jgi:glycerol kinase
LFLQDGILNPLNVEYRKLEALIPYARNPRTHAEAQIAKIAASIVEFGWTQPILVDGDNGIIAGHGRLAAARKLELPEVPVIELGHLTLAQKRAYVIADNRLALDAGWDDELLAFFNIPRALLPDVRDNAADYGCTDETLFGVRIPIRGMAGDQQAATVGQACFSPGMIKSTYGTGCFMVLNTGEIAVQSNNRLLTTIAYRLDGKPTYALEGSIFIAGAAVQWLRDALQLVRHASETEEMARAVTSTGGVYLVPAFTGLGAPYWDPLARGAIVGLTRDSGIAHIVRAALESVCYQSRDLLEAMQADGAALPKALRVDGGMVGNDWVMEFLTDILDVPVERPVVAETTALGAAYLAGLGAGIYQSLDQLSQMWQVERAFYPEAEPQRREALYRGWLEAVGRTRSR